MRRRKTDEEGKVRRRKTKRRVRRSVAEQGPWPAGNCMLMSGEVFVLKMICI